MAFGEDSHLLNRFQRIQNEFGSKALIRTSVLLVGLIGMAIFGFLAFSSIVAGIIAFVGLGSGFFLRQQIASGVEYYPRVVTAGLFVYPIVLFLGDKLGLENDKKLAIITATTVLIFDLQFWSLSDPSVTNSERSQE